MKFILNIYCKFDRIQDEFQSCNRSNVCVDDTKFDGERRVEYVNAEQVLLYGNMDGNIDYVVIVICFEANLKVG